MNLADAIRQAAGSPVRPPVVAACDDHPQAPAPSSGTASPEPPAVTPPAFAPEQPAPAPPTLVSEPDSTYPVAEATPNLEEFSVDEHELDSVAQLPEHSLSTHGNMIRLELSLTAEQMNGLLRSLIDGHRSILTTREAVSYLRIAQHKLEEMAERGEVPAFKLGGRWRFPKPALDEWLMAQTFHHTEATDAA